MKTLACGQYTVDLFAKETSRCVIYSVMERQDAEEVWRLFSGEEIALAAVSGVDWNRELSPWSAPRAFRGGDDFKGQGADFLETLIH